MAEGKLQVGIYVLVLGQDRIKRKGQALHL